MSNIGEIRQFHEQLRLLASAGIKLDLDGNGRGYSAEQLSVTLQQLEFHSDSGQTLQAPASSELQVARLAATPRGDLQQYRIAFRSWQRSGGSPEALAILVDSEVAASRLRTFRRLRMIHPFAWAAIIGLSLLILVRFYAPKAVSLANNMGLTAEWVDLLTAFRDSQVLWFIAVPTLLVVIVALFWRRSATSRLLSSDYGEALLRSAKVRQWLRLQEATGQPREAWSIACGESLEASVAAEPNETNTTREQTTPSRKARSTSSKSNMPSLVRWALKAADGETANELPFAKRIAFVRDGYETIDASHRQRLRNVMPRGPVVVAGGLAIAALGIAMFYPIVQMLLFVSGELGQAQ
ncbi:MAG: hypothetical protein ACE361_26775 [Aureliella sp.]